MTFYFIDPEITFLHKYFTMKGLEFPSVIEILLLFAYSILYSIEYFLDLVILNKCSSFHLILLATLGDLTTDCFNIFKKIDNLNVVQLIVSIILYVFEIFGILIFIETIVLHCCHLDKNVRKNIIMRGEEDVQMGLEMEERAQSFDEEENGENDNDNDNGGIH